METPTGMVNEVNPENAKADKPIVCNVEGKLTIFNAGQPINQLSGIHFIPSGIVITPLTTAEQAGGESLHTVDAIDVAVYNIQYISSIIINIKQ